jgi:hypothetical protein
MFVLLEKEDNPGLLQQYCIVESQASPGRSNFYRNKGNEHEAACHAVVPSPPYMVKGRNNKEKTPRQNFQEGIAACALMMKSQTVCSSWGFHPQIKRPSSHHLQQWHAASVCRTW